MKPLKTITKLGVISLVAKTYGQVTKPDGSFQIKDFTTQLCLTLQQENFQAAFDAENNKQNLFAVAEFKPCQDSYQAQWFSHNSNGRLSTENGQKCLTALPTATWSHRNLDSCDTWDGYTGAGTYLFSLDCGLEQDFGFGQSFNFEVTAEFGGVVKSVHTC